MLFTLLLKFTGLSPNLKGNWFSQETLSKNLNVSRQTINAIENNKYDPTLTLDFKLAKQFDITVDELFS
ncbi:helix-turn-helix transcriptional regulator [Staphylococcus succinus]|uniref:helix-turn-helix transcriptional regulator n=1 Tax=Staphylococcus succinus TaxID=61015 RepID=UPI000D1D7289|nr:helix-turn-helix transcriptional regulator [Staphylococcus succinus]PTI45836.1 transcriptional regulator [Staphylococcus succinus]RIN23221.1 transcriptional regulator [Staphylococcus succinus]